ncbi:sugar phosphate isomerase/epimerase [Candidatus Gracilibacteria bacterium]|nr:sugar phosphate isomerase/epimerase [Candidatus Gracilibacteria bacterium]
MHAAQFGIQLYTLRDRTATDMLGTLKAVSEMGYQVVEFAGYGNVLPQELRAALDAYGLSAPSAHVGLQLFEQDAAAAFADLQILGSRYAIIPYVGENQRSSVAAVQAFAAQLNALGEQARAAGLQLGYHNHNFEFAALDNTSMYEILLNETDPDLVALELDVFWVARAGVDPLPLIERLSGRLPLLHLKEMAADMVSDAPFGDGVLPWETLIPAAERAGVHYFIAEQDNPRDSLADTARSIENAKKRYF